MRGERGSGLLGTVLGLGIFLLLMLAGVQVLTHLYATSVLEAVAYDAVQTVSAASGPGIEQAEANARALLGGLGDDAAFLWDVGTEQVAVRITTSGPSVLPTVVADRLGLSAIEREYRMRVETFR